MRALAEACASGQVPAVVQVVVAPKAESQAIETARSLGLRVEIVPPGDEYGPRLLAALAGCDWICLAGLMRLLPFEVLQAFPNRILNIHPALLPRFGGKGMYGRHVHEAVIQSGEKESGVTIHYVNEHYDEGEILLQLRCEVRPDDTPETLAARVLKLEHEAYAKALKLALHLESGSSND
jgi:phosphoribosylglycinamide formyltransferase 1